MLNLVGIPVAFLLIYLAYSLLTHISKKGQVRLKVQTKQNIVKESMQKFETGLLQNGQLLTKEREDIVNMPVRALIEALQERRLTCLTVLKAYQAKAMQVTKELNCVTEFILEAEQWARDLDKSDIKGPLHGLPFSVKDNVGVIGYDCTIGLSKFLHQPHTADAALVQALKHLGGIPFCKTNIPQTLLSFGCGNPVWGVTLNPHDKTRTPGGSSGGEGCIVAAGASPFGLGSDIGGSVRAPAAFCGIASLKPTADRLSYLGYQKSVKGCIGVDAVAGIMARDIETVILINKLLLQDGFIGKFDPKLPPIPWRENKFLINRKLRIGYYDDDGFFPTTPGVKRSVAIARENLQKLGHELVPFQPINVVQALEGAVRMINADGAKYLLDICDGEPIDSSILTIYLGMRIPNIIKPMLKPVLGAIAPRLLPYFLSTRGYKINQTHQLWKAVLDQNELKEMLITNWKEQDLDLCIGPAFACPAPLIKDVGRLVAAGSYTMYYNYVNFPAGVVPVTKETEQDQLKLREYCHNDVLCKLVKKTTEGALGLPLSVQVIGLPFHEELILRGMEILNSTLN